MAPYSRATPHRSKLSLLSSFSLSFPTNKPYIFLSSLTNFPSFPSHNLLSAVARGERARSPIVAMASPPSSAYEKELAAAKKAASLAARLCRVRTPLFSILSVSKFETFIGADSLDSINVFVVRVSRECKRQSCGRMFTRRRIRAL